MSHEDGLEVQELHEQAEHAHANPQLLPVSFTVSLLAVLVAVVTLMGHRTHTEEVVTQIKASDTWSEYQAKNIRYHNYGSFADLVPLLPANDKQKSLQTQEHFRQQSERYDHEKDDLQREAKRLEAEVITERGKANRYDFGEALLEVALVITSITLLTRRKRFWYFGMAVGVLGLLVALTALTIR